MIKRREYSKVRRPVKRSKFIETIYTKYVRFLISYTIVIIIIDVIFSLIRFAYVEFVFLWLFVMGCDFLVEFRFEYFWPFYLLIKNVHDSFKLQGLVNKPRITKIFLQNMTNLLKLCLYIIQTFSVLFVVVALALDMICFMLLPVHWLFFVASTYVWLQYVWHTERELCIISASMCLFYIYIEAAVRFRDIKTLPFTLDLCRPFAAHWYTSNLTQ